MREQKANDNGFPVVGEQAKEQQIFPFEQLVEYDGAANKITINANVTINGDTNIGELDIDSGDAPKGQVLTADGDSGASWENRVEYLNLTSESGNLTNAQIEVAEQDNVIITLDGQFYYKNSQSDESIVFKAPAKVVDDDTIVEKVVIDLSDNTYSYSYEVVATGGSFEPTYDDELNDSSTNAVQNKVLFLALEDVAKVNGNYQTMTVGLANNLVATNGLTTTNSFIMELTGGDQSSAVSTGNMNPTLRGNSVVVNQLVNTGDTEVQTISGRKYWTFINGNYAIITSSGSAITLNDASVDKVVDLTKWFVSNEAIPQDLLDHPNKFINYYQGSLAYNTGHIENAQSTSLIGRGINQWDEQWESGGYGANGEKVANNSIRCKNLIEVIPGQTYYFKTPSYVYMWGYDVNGNYVQRVPSSSGLKNTIFTIPSNIKFITFRVADDYGTTYNNDICFNISDPDINGDYFASEANETPLGNDVLRSAGDVYDSKAPNGTITRRIGVVDLGSLGWQYVSPSRFYTSDLRNLIRTDNFTNTTKANITCAKYETVPFQTAYGQSQDKVIGVISAAQQTNAGYISIVDSAYTDAATFKQAMSGVYLYYELAEYTEEQGTPFAENIKVVKGGTLEFVGNGIPQGNSMFFQKNLKSFLEAFGTAINYDPSRIERLANLSFTPEMADIVLNPSPANAYAKVQVMSSTFTIVVSAALTGTASGTITFQDSEVDLTNFQTEPAKAIYDMDGKKVSEAPTTTDCNIASFVGRSYNGVILWSILHSGVNKIKIHFEQAIPLDENGNGKVDCRASLIL